MIKKIFAIVVLLVKILFSPFSLVKKILILMGVKELFTNIIVFILLLSCWVFLGTYIRKLNYVPPVSYSSFPIEFKLSKAYMVEPKVMFPAKLSTDYSIQVKTETSGRVTKIFVNSGDKVKAGDKLVELDAGDKLSILERAKVSLEHETLQYDAESKLYEQNLSSKNNLSQAKVALDNAKTNYEIALESYNKTKVLAPIDGSIDKRFVSVGDFVNTGSTIATVVNSSQLLKVTVNIAANYVGKIKSGYKARIFDQDNNSTVGKVTSVSKIVAPDTGTVKLEALLVSNSGNWISGYPVNIEISLPQRKAHKLPISVFDIDDYGRLIVKTVTKDNIIKFKPITVISENVEGLASVVGLDDEEKIIMYSYLSFSNNQDISDILDKYKKQQQSIAEVKSNWQMLRETGDFRYLYDFTKAN